MRSARVDGRDLLLGNPALLDVAGLAPDGPGWSDISAVWENVVHNPSQAGGGLSDVDYGTIIDSIGNSA